MEIPSIFGFATSELTQDAFIAWLASWADERYAKSHPKLCLLARDFLHSLGTDVEIKNVEAICQYKNIDIIIEVNETHLILIEDKTFTHDHSNQLLRYKEIIKQSDYKNHNLKLIYFKTADQARFKSAENAGYKPYTREDFLAILERGQLIENDILRDFTQYIRKWDERVKAYCYTEFEQWTGWAWIGFYKKICEYFNDADFGYVSNPSGGFEGCWMKFLGESSPFYLQIGEKNRISLRVGTSDKEQTKELKDKWIEKLQTGLDDRNIPYNSKYLRVGKTMALAHFEGIFEIKSDGKLDVEESILKLKSLRKSLVQILG